jgi:hypothetical protein
VLALVRGPNPRRVGVAGVSRSARLVKALGIAATAAAFVLGLTAEAAGAADPGVARAPVADAFQAQHPVPKSLVGSFSFGSTSVELPAAALREIANATLLEARIEARAARTAVVSRGGASAPKPAEASSPPATTPGVTDDPASGGRAPDAPTQAASDHERTTSPAPGDSPPIETSGSTVGDASGGFRQEHRARPRSHRWPGRRPGSAHEALPRAAVDSYARHSHDSHSTPTPPGHQAPQPPKDPGGALTAALGGSSNTPFGIFMAALIGLMACGAFRAPTRRAASPSDRRGLAPAFARLERPG